MDSCSSNSHRVGQPVIVGGEGISGCTSKEWQPTDKTAREQVASLHLKDKSVLTGGQGGDGTLTVTDHLSRYYHSHDAISAYTALLLRGPRNPLG